MSPMGVKTCRNSCPSFLILLTVLLAILLCISRRTLGAGLKEGCTPNEGRKLVLPCDKHLGMKTLPRVAWWRSEPVPLRQITPADPRAHRAEAVCLRAERVHPPAPCKRTHGPRVLQRRCLWNGLLGIPLGELASEALSADGLWDFFSQCQYTQTFSQKESGSVTSRHFFIVPYLG